MHIQIKLKFSDKILFEGEYSSIKEALEKANLRGADLYGANLYGADLYGADLRGEKLKITPVFISGLKWEIRITALNLAIGCEFHTHEEWTDYKRDRISQMDKGAGDWWKEHKEMLLNLCALHRKEADKTKEPENKELAI